MSALPMQSAGHPEGRPTLAAVPRGDSHDSRVKMEGMRAQAPRATPDLCGHVEYDALRNYKGSMMDDHESLDAQCRTCGAYVRVTIWSTRDEVDMRPLTDEEVAEYFA